ncbi:MAG: hypothetical protein NTZ77_01600 [Caldiserica bacterium]|nr:hypothetical protein [Caldisericota bacterium]
MRTTKSRSRSITATFMSILLSVVLAATGCAPKVVPVDGPQISALMLTNVTASAYDTVPFMWSVRQNTLQSAGTSVLHANNTNGEALLLWRSGSPLLAVQRWELMTATSKDLSLLVPPVGMESASRVRARWYVQKENAFVAIVAQNGTEITITQQGLATGSKAQTLAVPVPSGLQPDVLYGSGSIANGFVLFEAPQDKAPFVKPFSLWLLRISNGTTTWVRCGDASVFGGGFYSGEGPSFARVGSLLYITRSHTKIGYIDTAAASPSLTVPETLNTLLAKLYSEGPTDAESPLMAHLASDSDILIVKYPDMYWNSVYYAVDTSGAVLGRLRADKTSIVSFDAKGQQGFTLKTAGSPGYVSFPSIDLFESPVS